MAKTNNNFYAVVAKNGTKYANNDGQIFTSLEIVQEYFFDEGLGDDEFIIELQPVAEYRQNKKWDKIVIKK